MGAMQRDQENTKQAKEKGFRLIKQDLRDNGPGLLAVVLYIALFQFLFRTVCPMQLLLGLPCPGCGLTRAGLLLLSGHPVRSFLMHPFLYAWILILLDFGISRYLLGRKPKELIWLVAATILGMLILYGYRMAVFYPDTEPMQPLTEGICKKLWHIFQ